MNFNKLFYKVKELYFIFKLYFYIRIDPLEYIKLLYSNKRISPSFHEQLASYVFRARLINCILEAGYIKDGNKILDLGCGYGILSSVLDKAKLEISLIGIDISYPMIQDAKKKSLGLEKISTNYFVHDFHDIDFVAAHKFDAVFCIAINRFIYDNKKFTKNIRNFINNDSLVILRTLNGDFVNKIIMSIYNFITKYKFKNNFMFTSELESMSNDLNCKIDVIRFTRYIDIVILKKD